MSRDDIHHGLSRALTDQWTLARSFDVGRHVPMVVLSDQHKGAGDRADEFRGNEHTYSGALRHYADAGFTLILLGDVEELWENAFREVARRHAPSLAAEAAFGPSRYLRIWGNHDDRWNLDAVMARELGPHIPPAPEAGGRRVWEALRYTVTSGDTTLGTLLLLHGHQGSFASDQIRGVSRLALRGYRLLQNVFGICWFGGCTTPAVDVCLRGEHDQHLYEWAAAQAGTILIAGHTHRPVWAAQTHLQQLERARADLLARRAEGEPVPDTLLREVEHRIQRQQQEVGSCNDVPAMRPAYFNSGCCKFQDGDITALEIEDGDLRLVRWKTPVAQPPAAPYRTVLEQAPLEFLFRSLGTAG
jgi:predicted phosphodiesterase